jgi:hypothetical protein
VVNYVKFRDVETAIERLANISAERKVTTLRLQIILHLKSAPAVNNSAEEFQFLQVKERALSLDERAQRVE